MFGLKVKFVFSFLKIIASLLLPRSYYGSYEQTQYYITLFLIIRSNTLTTTTLNKISQIELEEIIH